MHGVSLQHLAGHEQPLPQSHEMQHDRLQAQQRPILQLKVEVKVLQAWQRLH
jgi:hypothetical protein